MAVFPAVFGLLMASLVTGQTTDVVEIFPAKAVRKVGEQLEIICRAGHSIGSCRFQIGKNSYILQPGDDTGPDAEVVYAGRGFESGECGALLKHVKEELNGPIYCNVPPTYGNQEIVREMRLYVSRTPKQPALDAPTDPYFREGYEFYAQCTVSDGRPAAEINWFLNNTEVFQDVFKPNVTVNPATDLYTISQAIRMTLTPDHSGLNLECRANHSAFETPAVARRQLVVHYPPKRSESSSTITMFGLKLGAAGRLNVSVRANPAPRAVWTINGLTLTAPQANPEETILAMEPLSLGDGYYNISLHLSHITKDDVERRYLLTVSNEYGEEPYTLLISTMDEPAGVELDTGAIVGIVVAVLILLAAVSLVVFAKATDRWCFAGGSRGRDHAKSSGESSDTESAVGGPGRGRSRLAELGARVRAALPRSKDKVQATEAQPADTEDKPLSEEKKSVVYAELQLGEQTSTEKPPPPSTEYAEIVYTDQPKETKE